MANVALYLHAQINRFKTLKAYRGGDWRNIPIEENGELLLEVPEKSVHPFYAVDLGIHDDRRVYLRERVLEKFFVACDIARRSGHDLIVYDGWRSIDVQKKLFWRYMLEFTVPRLRMQDVFAGCVSPEDVQRKFTNLPATLQTTMRELNRTYVSWPSSDPLCPSPHTTGGAIDVWLYKEGHPVNLGVPFDWMEASAGAFYHLKLFRKRFVPNDTAVSMRRNILLNAMTRAGFSCYGPEIWHFNFGNQMDALVRGGHARYSYREPHHIRWYK